MYYLATRAYAKPIGPYEEYAAAARAQERFDRVWNIGGNIITGDIVTQKFQPVPDLSPKIIEQVQHWLRWGKEPAKVLCVPVVSPVPVIGDSPPDGEGFTLHKLFFERWEKRCWNAERGRFDSFWFARDEYGREIPAA